MKLDIQSWIRIARRLGKHILEPSDIDTDSEIKIWRETYKSSEKVMKDLNDPHFFAQKAVLKEEINTKLRAINPNYYTVMQIEHSFI